MTLDVLAIFAHPDDAELHIGGSLLKMKHQGYKTGVLDVTRGEMGTRGTPEGREKEAATAARILKLDIRENLGLPDGHVFADDPSRTAVVRALRRLKPRNYDPETGGEKIAAPIVAHSIFSRRVVPSFIVDISEWLDAKLDAIRAHSSQFYDPDSNEPETMLTGKSYLDRLASQARYYGALIGVEAGEPFYVREALNVDDPVELLTRPMNLYS